MARKPSQPRPETLLDIDTCGGRSVTDLDDLIAGHAIKGVGRLDDESDLRYEYGDDGRAIVLTLDDGRRVAISPGYYPEGVHFVCIKVYGPKLER